MPHLDAAYNLARWLAGNDHDAEDITQDACVRAFRFLGGFRGGNDRSGSSPSSAIPRIHWLKKNRPQALVPIGDEEFSAIEDADAKDSALQQADATVVRAALQALPLEFREALVLRELEGLSYKEISKWRMSPSAP